MKTSYVICFVCGSKGANCILYVKPRSKGSYFSFLEYHDPPKGAKLPNGEGIVNACLVCYAFLNQQWDSFEKTKTPLVKRLYWLKRIDNRAFTGAELNVQGEYVAQIMGVQYNCGISGNVSPFEYGSHTGISCNARNFSSSPVNDSNVSPSSDEKPGEILGVLDLSVSPKKPKSTGQKLQKPEDIHGGTKCNVPGGSSRSKSGSIVCYICAKPSPMSLARFVFAIDQSDDDEPYFPFLLELAEPPGAMPLTRNGVTQVCSECRKALNRQWRFFDAQKVPVTDRVYKVKDLTISPGRPAKENASAKGACRLCDELHLLTSMHSLKVPVSDTGDGTLGILELVEKLKFGHCGPQPADGPSPVLVCSPCLDRVRSQRNQSDKSGLVLPGPVLNGTSSVFSFTSQNGATLSNGKKPASQKKSSIKNSSAVNGESGFGSDDWRRRTFKSTFAESSCADNTAVSTSCSTDSMFKLPFDSPVLQIKPDSSRHTVTDANLSQDEASLCTVDAMVHEKQTRLDDACKKLQPGDDSVCFLCGFICSRSREEWRFSSVMICDHINPNDGEDGSERPFFPFLRKLSPFLGAEEMNAEGCASVCVVCYHNLLTQWNTYEKSNDVKPSNRQLRSYSYRSFVCGVCNDNCERRSVEIVAVKEFEELGKLNAFTVDGKSRDFVLVCSLCCAREKVGDLFSGKVLPNSSYSTLKRVDNCPQIESHSVVVSKLEDDPCDPPVVVDGETPASNHQKNSSSPSSSLSPPLLSSPKLENRSNNASEGTNGGGVGEAGVKQKSRLSEHLLAGSGSGCLEALRKMAFGSAYPDFTFLNTSTETKKFSVGEKLRNGEEAVGGEVSVEAKKNFHPEGKNPAFITSNQNGFLSMQEHLPRDVDPPLGIKNASGKLEDFATAGTIPSRPVSGSSVLANISTSHSQLNGFPYSTSSLKAPNEHLLSSLSHPAFIPHLFPLMPDSLYMPEVLSPSSRLTFPLSNSSLSWEDYQTARKFQSALSASLPYQSLFHPSLAHPMLSFKPGAVSPYFYPAGSLPTASAGASAFDLAASFLRRGADSRDAEASDSCASSELDVCNERTESPFKFANGGDDLEKGMKIDEQNGHVQSSPRFRLGGKDRSDKGLSDSRTVSDHREKDFSFPRKKVPAKHNFHRPFLENDSVDGTKSGGTVERQKERRMRDDDTGTITLENSPPRDRRSVEPTSHSVESKPSEEVDSVYTLGERGVARRTVSNSGRSSIGFPSKCPAINDGIRDTGATEFQFKDERLNAAIGLISLYSAHIQSSPKRTASVCDSRNDSSTSDSKSNESSLPNSTMLPSNALETGVGKRLRLDSDNQRDSRITCDYGLICETGSAASPLNSSGTGEDLKSVAFPWPGVDAIIVSYQQYRQDYATEKSFLWDQDQRAGETRQLLLSTAEKLSNRITELTQTKKDLENERVQLQTHLDAFVSCVRELK